MLAYLGLFLCLLLGLLLLVLAAGTGESVIAGVVQSRAGPALRARVPRLGDRLLLALFPVRLQKCIYINVYKVGLSSDYNI